MLAQERIAVAGKGLDRGTVFAVAGVSKCDQRVSAQEAWIVPREVEAVVAPAQLVVAELEPLDERDVRFRVLGQRLPGAPLLDAAVPRADVLADVAAVDLGAERLPVLLGDRPRRLRPVREAACRVEHARLVEGARRARLDTQRAGTAVELQRLRALDLDVGDERSEHDPGTVPPGDQHRVLPVEAHAGAGGSFAVDVVVLVDEHSVGPAEPPAELVELLPQVCVRVKPRVAREPAFACLALAFVSVVAERCRDHAPRLREQRLGMTRDLGSRHREAHVGEQAARSALPDVTLGLVVRLGGRRADDVDPELTGEPLELRGCHARHCA